MPEVTINSQKKDMMEEEQVHNIVLGIDEAGFLCVRVHLGMGKWTLWGILDDAKNLVLGYFAQKNQVEAKAKGLVRPPNGFLSKWRR